MTSSLPSFSESLPPFSVVITDSYVNVRVVCHRCSRAWADWRNYAGDAIHTIGPMDLPACFTDLFTVIEGIGTFRGNRFFCHECGDA